VVFAKQRGVTIAVENTPNELGAPESLSKFIRDTHLQDLRLCFDIGHAHIGEGVVAGFELMRDRVVTTHIHDNHGQKDEHLWPGDGTIAWAETMKDLLSAPQLAAAVLEIHYLPEDSPEHIANRAAETFKMLEL